MTQLVVDPDAGRAPDVDTAFSLCRRVVEHHYENFSVVSLFVPARLRPHFCAVYAFCRGVDDLGDEYPGDRLAALYEWERQLRLCYEGRPTHYVFQALQASIEQFALPIEPFLDLIEANRLDQKRLQYQTWEELMEYCRYSANPVGRLVLALFGFTDSVRQELSDQTCTALQVANHLQDLGRDVKKGRIYLPLADMAEFGTEVRDLEANRASEPLRRCIQRQVERTWVMFQTGARLEAMVPYRLRLQLRMYRLGGQAVLHALARQGYDPLSRRPTVSGSQKLSIAMRVFWGH
ncbi:MAG: squalene synthase HpnC [Alicyclobacillus herbarius]|uniref:squalene synthase HpnC n=1 Tax=Alicyclobacillus herbarius TaxID=122960 RepID=UPI00040CDD4C|nr:squalene synthase HpnC [Alicyclobacillus herbarius]MCL6631217.1 squalene synthase HpnC [Alicyclobacillus herbarius]